MLLLFIYLFFLNYAESAVDYSDHIVVKIKPNTVKDLDFLKELEKTFKLDLWTHPQLSLNAILTDLSPSQLDVLLRLNQTGINYEIVSHNLQRMIEAQRPVSQQVYYSNAFDYEDYHRYGEIVTELTGMVAKYSKMMKIFTIGATYQNRSIMALTITNGSTNGSETSNKKLVMLECGIHAREWISIASCLWIINDLITNGNNSGRLDRFDFLVVPVLNVDGYEFTFTDDRKWRKTLSVSTKSAECRGADPNRNWNTEFCLTGASTDPCEETYCGDEPFSEIEAKSMAELVKQNQNKIAAYFAFHSYSQLWMYPWGYTEQMPPNAQLLDKLSRDAVSAIKATNGLTFQYGSIANTIYLASGSSVDWVYDTAGVKLAFAMEMRDTGEHGFLLPANQIKAASLEVWNGIKAVIDQI